MKTKNSNFEITKGLQVLISQLKEVNMKLWTIENEKSAVSKIGWVRLSEEGDFTNVYTA